MHGSKPRPKRLNILVLDGGGVRGLSSLLILQALMVSINQSVARLNGTSSDLHPHHVFQLVAGTSTGGLISLMLGKMELTVAECITQYEALSKMIFGKKHIRGRITHGLAPARYSGKRLQRCIRDLLRARGLDEDLSMSHQADRIACAVICREHCSSSQYSKLKNRAVPICSLPCRENVVCKVCDAARATSAAPTFFPVMSIQDRFFADGGLAHNNPSFAIYFHYTRHESKKLTKRVAPTTASAPEFSSHGDLDCSCVRFTNIGTGAKLSEVQPGRRDRLAGLLPGAIRKGIFLQQTLKEIAVNSEEKADVMRQFGYLNPDFIMYERFDANHGVSNIKLDNYNALEEIKEKTKLYLAEQGTKGLLEEVGWSIACDYLNIQPVDEQSRPQSTNSPTAESHQLLQAPKSMSALSAQSSAYSNISERPQNHSHVHSPTDDNLNNTRPASSSQDQAETVPSPGAQTQPRISQEDSGISGIEFEKLTKEPQASMVAAQA